jgi:hypothetical protein
VRRPTIRVKYEPTAPYNERRGVYSATLGGDRSLVAEARYPMEAVRKLLHLLWQVGRSRWLPDYELARPASATPPAAGAAPR